MSNYDLEERTLQYSEDVLNLCRSLRSDSILWPLLDQLLRSATSVGANYMEANAASSKRDFRNKIFICKKEAAESKYWLRLLARGTNGKNDLINSLEQEGHELNLIFQKISSSV